MSSMLGTTKCAQCGKEFIEAPESIYKVNRKGKVLHCCSWTCFNLCKNSKDRRKSK